MNVVLDNGMGLQDVTLETRGGLTHWVATQEGKRGALYKWRSRRMYIRGDTVPTCAADWRYYGYIGNINKPRAGKLTGADKLLLQRMRQVLKQSNDSDIRGELVALLDRMERR